MYFFTGEEYGRALVVYSVLPRRYLVRGGCKHAALARPDLAEFVRGVAKLQHLIIDSKLIYDALEGPFRQVLILYLSRLAMDQTFP